MKSKLKYLFVFLCFVASTITTTVYAYDKDTPFLLEKHDRTMVEGLYYISNYTKENNHRNSIYSALNSLDNNEQFFIYCADPNIPAFNDLQVDHILMGAESRTKAEDYGILTILKHGKSVYTSSTLTMEEQIDYEATSMAIRMFVNAILGWNYKHTTNAIFPTYIRTAYDNVMSDPEMQSAYQIITGENDPNYIINRFGYGNVLTIGFKVRENATDAEITLQKAKELLKKGMLATAAYKKGEIVMPEVDVITAGGTNVDEDAIIRDGDNLIYERFIVASIDLKNFSEGDPNLNYFYYLGTDNYSPGTEVQEIGVSLEYSENESSYSAGLVSANTNIVEYLKSKDADRLYIGYKVKFTTDGAACGASFNVNYKYNDANLLTGAMLFPANDAGKDYTSGQRFMMYSSNPVEDSHTVNAKMCDSYCAPTFELPHICEDDVDPDKINPEDGTVEYEYREGFKADSYEIEKCILKNSDSASNSYKLVDTKYAGIVASNPYCTISCKEEYIFKVPYKINVDNGRYFRISMSIKGQQDCYSSKIDSEQYEKDIKEAQRNLVKYYNEWMKYYELVNNPLESTGEYDKCYAVSCQYEPVSPTTGYCGVRTYWGSVTGQQEKKQITFKGTYYVYDEATGRVYASSSAKPSAVKFGYVKENKFGSCSYLNGVCDIVDNSNTCAFVKPEDEYASNKNRNFNATPTASNDVDYNIMPLGIYRDPIYVTPDPTLNTESYEYKLEYFEEKLHTAIEKLKSIIDLYNGCIGDKDYEGVSDSYPYPYWSMIYNYDPEITYSYDEPDPNDYDINKWIDEVKSISCEDQPCDQMIALEEKVYAEACDPDDDKCQNVTKIKPIFAQDDSTEIPTTEYCMENDLNKQTYECSNALTSAASTYEDKTYFNCEFDSSNKTFSCSNNTYKVTKISYVHRAATAEGKYDTARVYYSMVPSGGIEVSPSKIVNGNLVDGLPVGLTTPPGTYYYTLTLNNIGTYFSNGELGRIFGTKSTSLSNVERLEREQTINGNELESNEYACTYSVSQTCEDASGVTHDSEECNADEDWNTCKKRLCPTAGSYCVKEAESYYVCSSQYYDASTCTAYSSRDEAINNSQENYNCCPECSVLCVGNCVYDLTRYPDASGELNVEFRPITPSIINPNDRQMGYNWDSNNPVNVLVAQKAGNTISEIEERANLDIETATPEQLAAIDEYTLKVTMTPHMAQWIRNEENEPSESTGLYNDDDLTCYDYTLPNQSLYGDRETCSNSGYTWDEDDNACKMANAFCYSNFITRLKEAFTTEVDAPKRDLALNNAHSNYVIYKNVAALPHKGGSVGVNSISYEIQTINDYWTIYTYTNLDINGDKVPDIGPAWK
ncbi:MAG: hypothetical protein E7164_04015 [Firmicutes bacterium]|nr:hypothetical protein [Bacillota bacterium]